MNKNVFLIVVERFKQLYDNDFTYIIDIYFYEYFSTENLK